MKKSELIEKLIELEKEQKGKTKITMDYIHYLQKLKRLVQIGDVEL